MNCPKCPIEPNVREGKPIKDGDNVFILQIYACNNPQCANYNKDIGETRTDIFDNSVREEIYYTEQETSTGVEGEAQIKEATK